MHCWCTVVGKYDEACADRKIINSLLPVSRYIDMALAEKGSHKKKLTTRIFGHCWLRNGQFFQPSIILENIHNKISLNTNFLENAYSPPGAPLVNFFPQKFQKYLSLSPTNPNLCIVTPKIGKINCRQEGVKTMFSL